MLQSFVKLQKQHKNQQVSVCNARTYDVLFYTICLHYVSIKSRSLHNSKPEEYLCKYTDPYVCNSLIQ